MKKNNNYSLFIDTQRGWNYSKLCSVQCTVGVIKCLSKNKGLGGNRSSSLNLRNICTPSFTIFILTNTLYSPFSASQNIELLNFIKHLFTLKIC